MGLADRRTFDLGRTLEPGVPRHPAQHAFVYRMTQLHGEEVYPGGLTAANDYVEMSTHLGTHVDAPGHFAVDLKFWDGADARVHQHKTAGLDPSYSIEAFERFLWPTVVADIPRLHGVDRLDDGHLVTAEELRAAIELADASITPQSALLIRTGWGSEWPDLEYGPQPGPGLEAVAWASEQGVRLFGSDTLVFEWSRDPALPVHRRLLAVEGANILEGAYLEEVCAEGVLSFVMAVAPLKVRGATAGPVRPIAILP